MKQIAQRIFRETVAAMDVRGSVGRKLTRRGSLLEFNQKTLDLGGFREILGIAFGKAAFSMAAGFCDVLATEYRPEGILVVPAAPPRPLPGWKTFIGGHPVPDQGSIAAGRAILERLALCDLSIVSSYF